MFKFYITAKITVITNTAVIAAHSKICLRSSLIPVLTDVYILT